jgi:hypothetical protein
MNVSENRPAQPESPGLRIDSVFQWLKWGGVLGIVLVYLRFQHIYSNPYPWPYDDPYFYTNNNFFFSEHWLVTGILAVFTWAISIADRWSSNDEAHGWRSFVAAFVASALALMFWAWAALLAMIAYANYVNSFQ